MRHWLLPTCLLAATASLAADPARVDPGTALAQIQGAKLDPSRSVTVRGLELDMGAASLLLEEGVLVPAAAGAGRAAEFVFLGRGRFRLDPPDAIEAGQLELFSGEPALDEPVRSAVLAVASPLVAASLAERSPAPPLSPALLAQSAQVFQRWTSGAERKGFGAEAAILAAAAGDEAYRGYFAALCSTERLGDFYYVFDPTEPEQINLGQFKPIELDPVEEGRLEGELRRDRRRGHSLGLRREDVGDRDTWVSMSLPGKDGASRPGEPGFEPRHYAISARLTPGEQRIAAAVKIELTATVGGRRFVALQLFNDLVVRRVTDGAGQELFWHRSGTRLGVLLPIAPEAGTTRIVQVDYDGVLLDELEKGIYSVRDTQGWYPRCGSADRATYDVTLHWPQRFQLLASGQVAESGTQEGWRWERRRLSLPALAFTFEVGDFDVVQDRAGHVALTVAFSKASGTMDKGAPEEVVETLKRALAFFEATFGPYPLDYLTVVTVPRGYSQGFLSMITVSHLLVWHPPRFIISSIGESRTDKRTETIAHELAHQWWGNMVGWQSYRDQWLSEALANYSAMAFVAHEADSAPIYLVRRAMRWRRSVEDTTEHGRTLESLGPIVLGRRLFSSLSDAAYEAVVYDKGYVVFSMLALTLGDEPFRGMLKDLVHAVNNRTIQTGTFIKALERMSGVDLKAFAGQFVYGTGIPEISYASSIVHESDGSWSIRGAARQTPAGMPYRSSVHREQDGWRVERQRLPPHPAAAAGDLPLVVPFQVAVEEASATAQRKGEFTTVSGFGGTLVLRGETTEFSIPQAARPKRFWLDQWGEVFAKFVSRDEQSKQSLRIEAEQLAARGAYDEAEGKLREALGSALYSKARLEDDPIPQDELEKLARNQDTLIQLELAGLLLDRDRRAEARVALDAAESLLPRFERNARYVNFFSKFPTTDRHRAADARVVVASRLDVLAGDHTAAYERLSQHLRLDLRVSDDDAVAAVFRKRRFAERGRVTLGADAYALLAVAAHETGHAVIARAACEAAEERGADMGALEALMGAQPAR